MSQAHTKSLRLHCKAASAPTAEQLVKIRVYTLRDFTADELVVREYLLAHNGIDRDQECFSPALLDEFARTLPGKGVFIRHPGGLSGDGGPGEGLVYAAVTERMPLDAARIQLREARLTFPPDAVEATLLKVSAYYVRTPDNESFLRKLDGGIGGDVSIAFLAKRSDRLKDSSGVELNVWRWDAPGEALEMSHVWLGAQPGARVVKTTSRDSKENTMDPNQKQIADLTAERDQHKAAADANAKAAASYGALVKHLGEDATLLDNPVALLKAVTDGRAHRTSLINDIVAVERQLGITGDTPEAVTAAKALYADFPTDKLDGLRKGLELRLPGAQSRTNNSDPNKGAPGIGTKSAADSPLSNPMLAQ